MRYLVITIFTMLLFVIGCSGGGSPSAPDVQSPQTGERSLEMNHSLWGLWQVVIDPDAETMDFTRLRAAGFHLNALPFLEPPVLLNLTLETLQFNGDIIDADIGLRHPFLGLTEFTGFDVCGTFISNGTVSGFTDSGIVMPGETNTRLLNPDAYSRWWNPTEFPSNGTIFGYTDGLLGAPDSVADFSATLNGCKYFCDDLDDPEDPLTDVMIENRGMFSAGQKNVRHYTIQMADDGLVFNYAVDASWLFPQGDPPFSAPDDFAPSANRTEAWFITVTEIENTLYNDGVEFGGDLGLGIDVYDWFNADMNTVRVESPGNFIMTETPLPTAGGPGFSTYQIDIPDATPTFGDIDLLISVISDEPDFAGFVPGANTAAYFTYTATVAPESPAGYHWEFDVIDTFAHTYYSNPISQEFDDISPCIVDESDNEIYLTWAMTDTNEVWDGIDSVFPMFKSTDNGVTYDYINYGDSGGENLLRADRNKICRGTQNDSYAVSGFNQNAAGTGWVYVVWTVNPWTTANRGVFVSYPTRDIEVFQDSTGYIYCFDDDVGNIEMKHSTAPNTLNYWTWHDTAMYPTYTVATSAYCSHARSAAEDSTAVVWLAYYDNAETQIKLARSLDTSPHESWNSDTVVYTAGAGISQVKSPSIYITSTNTFHICYTRYNSSTSMYELVYTLDDSSFDNPMWEVVVESALPINDNHISIGQKFGKEVIIFGYETGNSIYLVTFVDGAAIGEPEEIDGNTDDIDPDVILDTDQCDMHSVWSTIDGTNYDIARRNGVLVED